MNILQTLKETLNKFWRMLIDLPEFLEGVKEEMGRLTWPDWNSLLAGTVGVIAILIFTTIFIWVFDLIISRVILAIVGA